ncbi:adenylate/guanylate cyclase domain-containing protein [Spongiimicrobium sp. 3-5]|uniref:adenylate/guanylate cyclase domain-containing protein n=1 Tax=Spongiimicrobium sp. 3-5 TaxID=3332596 RepID=UPI0039803D9A
MFHPRIRRYFWQVLSFGIIWLFFGLLYISLELGLLGDSTEYPSTGNKYNFWNSLIFTGTGSFVVGLLQGWIEVTWFKKLFMHNPFWAKILFKSGFYLVFVIVFLAILVLTANAQLVNTSILDPVVTDSLSQFMRDWSFWSVVIYSGVILEIALFYSEAVDYMGSGVIYNYSFGKYHRPVLEERIFMFLDMKSSTSIAETLGHKMYFNLLKNYYADMTNAILETSGEIYQYVGDEIVVSWSVKNGLRKNNCIRCFAKISKRLQQKEDNYIERFGLVPAFKAGYHIGEVTTGEIGIIKRNIIYTGDVLNTTARIQAQCNEHNTKILLSKKLADQLETDNSFSLNKIGEMMLRGKKEPIQLLSINFS